MESDREYLTAWLQQQRDLMAKATKGPWREDVDYSICSASTETQDANNALIVSAVNAHPALLAMVGRGVQWECPNCDWREVSASCDRCYRFKKAIRQLAAYLRAMEAGR